MLNLKGCQSTVGKAPGLDGFGCFIDFMVSGLAPGPGNPSMVQQIAYGIDPVTSSFVVVESDEQVWFLNNEGVRLLSQRKTIIREKTNHPLVFLSKAEAETEYAFRSLSGELSDDYYFPY